jgi:hypothetical protein
MLRRWARIRRYAVCRYARMQAAVNQEKEAMNDSILSGLALLADHKAHVEVRVSRPARYPASVIPTMLARRTARVRHGGAVSSARVHELCDRGSSTRS